ncbi:MAG: SDR family oxidoreductase [Geothrix sp.]|nr:SDR family oxidoreductase [Geothrix sp.]
MNRYEKLQELLLREPRTWLVTGVAGFIGSNLLETLLRAGQAVVGLDNFATGFRANLENVRTTVNDAAWARFRLIEGDTRDMETCHRACSGVDYVLHQAALGSVPRSIADPLASHQTNVDGTLHMFIAARDAGVQRLIFASSSSVYGDNQDLPKVEDRTGTPLSPYALTKRIGEEYAAVFSRTYGFHVAGLRYFNVFGPRQNILGPYSAVIPRWITALLAGNPCTIYGDGETARDFTYVANVVQANLLAATSIEKLDRHRVFNVACGSRMDLNDLYQRIQREVGKYRPAVLSQSPHRADFRDGDIRHSLADISQARSWMGYEPTHGIDIGLAETVRWFAT